MKIMTKTACLILVLGFCILGCERFDDDPCTFQKGEKITITARLNGFADHFIVNRTCSADSILEEDLIRVYLVIKDSRVYTERGDKITLQIIEKPLIFLGLSRIMLKLWITKGVSNPTAPQSETQSVSPAVSKASDTDSPSPSP